jgi:hypothetical protein
MAKMFENTDGYDIAWVAGLFEGEGCIARPTHKRTRKDTYTKVQLGSVDRDIIARFDIIVGAGSIYESTLPSGKQWYEWNITNIPEVKEFIAVIWPYLGERRRAKATELDLAPV